MVKKPSAKSVRIASWCQIVMIVPWPYNKFVQASTAQACGVA
jgi:hypothetical protein